MSKVDNARLVAEHQHSNQSYDIFPYVKHIKDVVNVLSLFTKDPDLTCAAWLHDCIEDGHISYNDVKKFFGERTAELVFAVTDGDGRNRKERKIKSYERLVANPEAILVKLADRIANTEHSFRYTPDKFKKYQDEFQEFKEKLTKDRDLGKVEAQMWELLEQTTNQSNG